MTTEYRTWIVELEDPNDPSNLVQVRVQARTGEEAQDMVMRMTDEEIARQLAEDHGGIVSFVSNPPGEEENTSVDYDHCHPKHCPQTEDFLKDILAVYRKHNLCFAPAGEDCEIDLHDSMLVVPFADYMEEYYNKDLMVLVDDNFDMVVVD